MADDADNASPNNIVDVDNDEGENLHELCTQIKQTVPSELGSEAWYLIIAAIFASSPNPERLARLYEFLTTSDSTFSTPEAQSHLSRRLRDVLLKQVTLVGAPQVLCALIPLAQTEGDPEGKAGGSELSEKWANINVPSLHARGVATIDTIYGASLLPRIFASFGAHSADVQFMELFTVYGMYLSDFEVLSALETEVVVFVTIMCTGLRGPSLWHMRGLGRLLGARGVDESTLRMARVKDVLRAVKVAAMTVVEFCGEEMVRRTGMESERGWVNVGDVVRDVGGWGDDDGPVA